ncbi:hypothetical protein HPP92_017732 [Vanilla planifolia]|uniref:Phytocyanin domain-containing protein n=1 Tax=Vanilla planifolia TaxID=51239 RepID=A0A835UMB7_VANPL|nr:hypothetical protein HPP92_018343 [Vanilla planifolia]KAG0468404.1 hypothetical protein HPP92_017732 [Vanilla planifolia]
MSSSLLRFGFLLTLCGITFTEAKEFLVGGATNAWTIPSTASEPLNQWAESTRFLVGDYLVWKYDPVKDSVLQVRRKDYLSCNTSKPIAEHRDGETRLRLRRSGPFYFISGADQACEKGEKLVVVVMSQGHWLRTVGGVSPAPSPAEGDGDSPALAPVTGGAQGAVKGSFGFASVLLMGTVIFLW